MNLMIEDESQEDIHIAFSEMDGQICLHCHSAHNNIDIVVTFSPLQMSRLHCSVSGVRLSVGA